MSTAVLLDSLQLSVVAMLIVFATLYLLSLVMAALPKLVGQDEAATKTKPEQPAPAVAEKVGEPMEKSKSGALSTQTVAVIATAIAAYLGRAPEDLNIVAIHRTGAGLNPWAYTARRESIQN